MANRNRVGMIIAFENGELDTEGVLNLFADLIEDGTCWQLQGTYGRTASRFIEAGLIDSNGKITDKGREVIKKEA